MEVGNGSGKWKWVVEEESGSGKWKWKVEVESGQGNGLKVEAGNGK